MILLRTWSGIRDHFPARVAEWIMVVPALGLALAFDLQPHMFNISPTFGRLQEWADEETWKAICLAVGTVRLIALTVNGTFASFRYAPHLRALAALLCGLFWAQFSLGLLLPYLEGTGALALFVAISTLALFELANLFRASADVGAWARARW